MFAQFSVREQEQSFVNKEEGSMNQNTVMISYFIFYHHQMVILMWCAADGVHLSVKGYWLWAKTVRTIIDRDMKHIAEKMAESEGER